LNHPREKGGKVGHPILRLQRIPDPEFYISEAPLPGPRLVPLRSFSSGKIQRGKPRLNSLCSISSILTEHAGHVIAPGGPPFAEASTFAISHGGQVAAQSLTVKRRISIARHRLAQIRKTPEVYNCYDIVEKV